MRCSVAFPALFALIAILILSGTPAGSSPPIASLPTAVGSIHSDSSAAVHPLVIPGTPYPAGMSASLVLLQANFTAYVGNVTNRTGPGDTQLSALSPQGAIWAVDFSANRVLGFDPPFHSGEAASIVIGQSNFTGRLSNRSAVNLTKPSGVAFDREGDLWVSDWGNARLLEFEPPFQTGMAASLVIGQSNFTGGEPGTSARNISGPNGLAFDGFGNLWVSEQNINRVVEFLYPFSNGMAASKVLGQTDFTGRQSGTTAFNLSSPYDVAISLGYLWVADGSNNRVLGYPLPVTTGESATVVLGQSNFTTNDSAGPQAMAEPLSVSIDVNGNLWVSDGENNRVLEFAPPFLDFQIPVTVIGQSSLLGTYGGTSATNLSEPFGAFVAPGGGLWVTDAANARVLEYVPAAYSASVQETGLPTGTPWTAFVDVHPQTGVGPFSFSVLNGSHIFSVDAVPGYRADPAFGTFGVNGSGSVETVDFTPTAPNPFSQGMAASVVLGQIGFNSRYSWPTSGGAQPNGSSFTGNDVNYAAAFDPLGDLFVTDSGGNRVLEFLPPFTNGMSASVVIGQSSFAGRDSGVTGTNLTFPDGVAIDPRGNLWVADFGANRVLEYAPPFINGEAASRVLGQPQFTSSTAGHNATSLNGPAGITWFGGALWVADQKNNRVLEYIDPTTNGPAASLVLGQTNFTGDSGATTAVNESLSSWISFDARGDAWLADEGNNRVLEYPTPLATGEAASVVLGQHNFTSRTDGFPQSLARVSGVAVDSYNDVWVADSSNNRVLEFTGPTFVNNQTPALVVGQGNFSEHAPSLGTRGMAFPTAVIMDPNGDLWVVDGGNNRVLGYVPAQYEIRFVGSGLPSSTPLSITVNGTPYPTSAGSVTIPEWNGTFSWNLSAPSGWSVSVVSGSVTINGANVTVLLAFEREFQVTFAENGLTLGTNWSVTLGSTTNSALAPADIEFTDVNGTYGYTVEGFSGYQLSNPSGNVLVSGGPQLVTVAFKAPGLPSSSSAPGSPYEILGLVAVVVIVGALISFLVWRRRGKGPGSSPPLAWAPPSTASTEAPPPGGTELSPPPPPTGGPSSGAG